jgi:esterase/lipase
MIYIFSQSFGEQILKKKQTNFIINLKFKDNPIAKELINMYGVAIKEKKRLLGFMNNAGYFTEKQYVTNLAVVENKMQQFKTEKEIVENKMQQFKTEKEIAESKAQQAEKDMQQLQSKAQQFESQIQKVIQSSADTNFNVVFKTVTPLSRRISCTVDLTCQAVFYAKPEQVKQIVEELASKVSETATDSETKAKKPKTPSL